MMMVVVVATRAMLVGTTYAVAGAELLDHVVKDVRSAELLASARKFFAEVQRYDREHNRPPSEADDKG